MTDIKPKKSTKDLKDPMHNPAFHDYGYVKYIDFYKIVINFATKEDLRQVRDDINQVRDEINQVRVELKNDIAQVRVELNHVRTELKGDIEKVRTELKNDIKELRTEMNQGFAGLYKSMRNLIVIGSTIISGAVVLAKFVI